MRPARRLWEGPVWLRGHCRGRNEGCAQGLYVSRSLGIHMAVTVPLSPVHTRPAQVRTPPRACAPAHPPRSLLHLPLPGAQPRPRAPAPGSCSPAVCAAKWRLCTQAGAAYLRKHSDPPEPPAGPASISPRNRGPAYRPITDKDLGDRAATPQNPACLLSLLHPE